jgi:hypothetical protein
LTRFERYVGARGVPIRMDFARSAFGVRCVLASLFNAARHRAQLKKSRPANVTQISVEQFSIENKEEE